MKQLHPTLQSQRAQLVILLALTLLAFGNTLFHQFVYDDVSTVVNNTFITSVENLPKLFTHEYFLENIELSYRPVVTLSYFWDFFMWQKSPTGFHLTNVLLHLLNAVLVFVLLRRFFGASLVSLYGALVFSLHPVTTETVNLVSYREDLLATLFFLGALISYMKARRAERHWQKWAVLSFICAPLAYFSKESAAALVPVLLLLEIATPKKPPPEDHVSPMHKTVASLARRATLLAAHAALFAGYLLVRFVLMTNPDAGRTAMFAPTLLLTGANFLRFFAYYCYLLIYPVRLCADYHFVPILLLRHPVIIASAVFLLLYVTIAVIARWRAPLAFFCLGWILLTLLPVSNLVPLRNPVAERYLYLPLIGFALLLAWIVNRLLQGAAAPSTWHALARRLIAIICLAQILAYFTLTVWRNTVWGNEEVLWGTTLACEPRSATALNNLGLIYVRRGDLARARTVLEHAQQIDPSDAKVWNNLGVLYAQSGNPAAALQSFQIALGLNPRSASAHYNLARLYAGMKPPDYERAWEHLAVAKRHGYAVPLEFEASLRQSLKLPAP
jgi:tetratricopeptide (TPR) repeat protein